MAAKRQAPCVETALVFALAAAASEMSGDASSCRLGFGTCQPEHQMGESSWSDGYDPSVRNCSPTVKK